MLVSYDGYQMSLPSRVGGWVRLRSCTDAILYAISAFLHDHVTMSNLLWLQSMCKYKIITWCLMASINWRNVPASSFRVGKPNNPRTTMAACFSPAPQASSQKDVPSIGQDEPSPPLELKHHCRKEDDNTSIYLHLHRKGVKFQARETHLPRGAQF